jgi:neprilysin
MVDTAVFYGADQLRAEKEMMDTLYFEMNLTNVSRFRLKQEFFNLICKFQIHQPYVYIIPMTLTELEKNYSYVHWLAYMNDILPKDVRIDNDEVIIVVDKNFFTQLGIILKDTPKRTMANYVMWRITQISSLYLTEDLQKRDLKYKMDVRGTQDIEPRWKECVNVVTSVLTKSVSGLYIRRYFREDVKKTAIEMVENFRLAFENILQTVEWMDAITRERALHKLETMILHIGYPDELLDDKKLEEYYEGLEVNIDYYLESVLRVNQFNYDKYFLKLREPVKRTDWPAELNVAVVGTNYFYAKNSIG